MVNEKKKVTKYFNRIQLNKNVEKRNENLWETNLQDANLDWKNIYQTPFKTTLDTTLRNFQYKIIMGILPTNTLLVKYKIKDSPVCDLCNNSEETLVHIFWECQITQSLWNDLQMFLTAKSINLPITKTSALLGLKTGYQHELKNYLLILMKRFIYIMKIQSRRPTFTIFLNYLSERIKSESLISLTKNKYNTRSDIFNNLI